jgi:mannose-1-phosphate guanylyltransferase
LDWKLERLAKSGIKEVILAVNYMAEAFSQRYGDSAYGMKLFYSKEEKPLGTGGPIKNAEELIGREKSFLVLNGDILTNLDYSKLVKEHREKDATATIALYQVEDPSRYGVAELTEKNRIVQFVEKPSRNKAPSNLINAGVYVLEPKIFDYVPSGQPVSIERKVFPKLADEGKLHGYPFEGLWTDIGKLEDYLKANKIKDPTIVGEKVVIGEKSEIGPYVAVGERAILGKEVHVQNSVIFSGTEISDFTTVQGAVIGEDVTIGRKVKIGEGCMIGDHAVIRDNVTLAREVTVCPSREVTESVLTPKCLI